MVVTLNCNIGVVLSLSYVHMQTTTACIIYNTYLDSTISAYSTASMTIAEVSNGVVSTYRTVDVLDACTIRITITSEIKRR